MEPTVFHLNLSNQAFGIGNYRYKEIAAMTGFEVSYIQSRISKARQSKAFPVKLPEQPSQNGTWLIVSKATKRGYYQVAFRPFGLFSA